MTALRRIGEIAMQSEKAWPRFALGAQTLFIVEPAGPVFMAGDRTPPPEFQQIDARGDVFRRDGSAPDSLAGLLRIGLNWNGGRANATAVRALDVQWPGFTRSSVLAVFLIHEAFHTFQAQRRLQEPGTFTQRGITPRFPDTVVSAVAWVNLEGLYLARALRATTVAETRRLAHQALGIRDRRCAELGPQECAAERDIEQNEGSAQYVTATLTGAVGERVPPDGPWRDTLVNALSPVTDLVRLGRLHYYDTGHAWLVLLERIGPADWRQRVERAPPDRVLGEALAASAVASDSLSTNLVGAEWAGALARAEAAIARARVEANSAERAFWERPGVVLRVYPGAVRSTSSEHSVGPNGSTEVVFQFDGGPDKVTFRAPMRSVCCPVTYVTVAPVAGRNAIVDGRAVPLDHAGVQAVGSLSLDLGDVTIRFGRATISVFLDSIAIRRR